MLSSITPLGQRGRGMSWGRTLIGFWVGAMIAGTLVFGAAGAVGGLLELDRLPTWNWFIVLGIGAALDLLHRKPPGPKRQVNEDWLGRYRDWVTGAGFGLQLGAGLATIIPAYAVWSLFLLAALGGLPLAALLGLGFAVGRCLLLLRTADVDTPSALVGLMTRFSDLEGVAITTLLVGYAIALTAVATNVV